MFGHVREEDLDFGQFSCCGDEDLYPFGCPECGHSMVWCYECDTLYFELRGTMTRTEVVRSRGSGRPLFTCPDCGYDFEPDLMTDPRCRVRKADWLAAGLGHLLHPR